MTVSYKLLAELVSAHEASEKYLALVREVTSIVSKEGGAKAYRYGSYNISVDPNPMRGPFVTIKRVQELDGPQSGASTLYDALFQTGVKTFDLNAKTWGQAILPGASERETAKRALEVLQTGFAWYFSEMGIEYWREVANKLRKAAGLPLQS